MVKPTKENPWFAQGEKPTVSESDLNVLLCDDDRFTKMYLGEFKVDASQLALDERLLQYYKETENCDNKYAMERWKEFKRWAIGYSSKEINQAKTRAGNKDT
mgnify:CR=1 FL=1